MTDRDDGVSRRYRELAREEPSSALDRAILDKARGQIPVHTLGVRPRFSWQRWAGPVSIAAVLVLGIGVSLRMQLDQPGIETSTPSPASEYSLPPSAEPAPSAEAAPPRAAATPEGVKPAEGAPPTASRKPAPAGAPPRPFADESFNAQPQGVPAAPAVAPAPSAAPTAPAFAPAPSAADRATAASAAEAGAAPAPHVAPLRAKREAASIDSQGARELRKSVAPEAERDHELERIAKMREAGKHTEADRALEEFRRRYPDFRIPAAIWERVKPR